MHSDDVFYSNLEFKMLQSLNADVHFFSVKMNYGRFIFRSYKSKSFLMNKTFYLTPPPHTGMILSKRLVENLLFDVSYKISADFDQILKILRDKNLRIEYHKETLVSMKAGGLSTKLGNFVEQFLEDKNVLVKNGINNALLKVVMKKILKVFTFRFRVFEGKNV